MKGDDVTVVLEVTLRDLYMGRTVELTRVKGVYKESGSGRTRQCKCQMKTTTRQMARACTRSSSSRCACWPLGSRSAACCAELLMWILPDAPAFAQRRGAAKAEFS